MHNYENIVKILDESSKPISVNDLFQKTKISKATIRENLGVLTKAGQLKGRRFYYGTDHWNAKRYVKTEEWNHEKALEEIRQYHGFWHTKMLEAKNYTLEDKSLTQEIIEGYRGGMSLSSVSRKFGISPHVAGKIMRSAGVIRSPSETRLFHRRGWRKLIRQKYASGNFAIHRILCVPGSILKELGVDVEKDLLVKLYIEDGKLILKIKEDLKNDS